MTALATATAAKMLPVRMGRLPIEAEPFPYVAIPSCLNDNLAEDLLGWFENDAPWSLVRHDFYEQYEFALEDASHPAAARLTDGDALVGVCAEMETLFGCCFSKSPRIVAHRLVPGQRIDIHNDSRPGGETHRLLIQLNRGLEDVDGGFLMLFSSSRATDVAKILRPQHCSAVAFAISERSYHAVSKMHGGERYTLVYSFRAEHR